MLQRSEIATRGHVLLWLAGKPEHEAYTWIDPRTCPAGQYAATEMGEPDWHAVPVLSHDTIDGVSLTVLARDGEQTFGALFERARKAWTPDIVD